MVVQIKDLLANVGRDDVTVIVMLEDLTLSTNKNGTSWQALKCSDSTGTFNAKVWKEAIREEYGSFVGKVVKMTGLVDVWNGQPGMAVASMELASKDEYNMSDFTDDLPEELAKKYKAKVVDYIENLSNPRLKALMKRMFSPSVLQKFCELPAGLSMHHAFNGALIVHTLEVTDNAVAAAKINMEYGVAKKYHTPINLDLVVCGALLHDYGKITEYTAFPGASITKRGLMLGHLTDAAMMITAYNLTLPKEEQYENIVELAHMILSSHYSAGPNMPVTKEAMIVSQADMASAAPDGYDSCAYTYDKAHPGNHEETIKCGFTGNYIVKK